MLIKGYLKCHSIMIRGKIYCITDCVSLSFINLCSGEYLASLKMIVKSILIDERDIQESVESFKSKIMSWAYIMEREKERKKERERDKHMMSEGTNHFKMN